MKKLLLIAVILFAACQKDVGIIPQKQNVSSISSLAVVVAADTVYFQHMFTDTVNIASGGGGNAGWKDGMIFSCDTVYLARAVFVIHRIGTTHKKATLSTNITLKTIHTTSDTLTFDFPTPKRIVGGQLVWTDATIIGVNLYGDGQPGDRIQLELKNAVFTNKQQQKLVVNGLPSLGELYKYFKPVGQQ